MRQLFRAVLVYCVASGALVTFGSGVALAQYGRGGGMGRPSTSIDPSGDAPPSSQNTEAPEVAAKKAFAAGVKALNKAKDLDAVAAAASNPDKKAKALDKAGDYYVSALDKFTEALGNKDDLVDAWDNVGYIHMHLVAYPEAIDDYNHALALKPDLWEAVERRGEAYLAVNRLNDAKNAYMTLSSHAPDLAAQLLPAMTQWVKDRRVDAGNVQAADIDAFDQWVQARSTGT